jgi:hypothetical protein
MARRPSLRRRIRTLIDEREPVVASAFQVCIDDIKAHVSLAAITEALGRGDIEGAISAIGIDRAAFAPLEEALRQAYAAGGAISMDSLAAMTRGSKRAASRRP